MVELRPVGLFGQSLRSRTAMVSPGSASSMWKGPVRGFGPSVTFWSEASWPALSTVVVITVSPSAMRRAGLYGPKAVW